MGFMTYFAALVLSGIAALLLRGLLRWLTRTWQPSFLLAVIRAFPIAFAFAPTLLEKRGLGVLIPASLYLFPQLGGLPLLNRPLDGNDKRNLCVAAASFVLVWGVAAVILFFRQTVLAQKTTTTRHKD
jgi:hypothetical protein